MLDVDEGFARFGLAGTDSFRSCIWLSIGVQNLGNSRGVPCGIRDDDSTASRCVFMALSPLMLERLEL